MKNLKIGTKLILLVLLPALLIIVTLAANSLIISKTEKDLNAAQIAYWVEFGTSRLRGGGRKSKKGDYSDEDLIKVNGTSFLSSAMYSSMKAQEEEFKREFNRLMNELKR